MSNDLSDYRYRGNGINIDIPFSDIEKSIKDAQELFRNIVFEGIVPYMPMESGLFIDLTRQRNAQLKGTDKVCIGYGPQAWYLYEGKKMVNSKTGKGPMLIPEVGFRYKKGTVLEPTEDPLVFSDAKHENAQSHWDEPAIAENFDKWQKTLQEYFGG